MTNEEFQQWQDITAASDGRWIQDIVYSHNRRGAFYYKGGEDGIYIEAQSDGMLTVGRYEGAFPHIGEASFGVALQHKYDSYNEAFENMRELGGWQFMADMFSQPEIIAPPTEPEMEL